MFWFKFDLAIIKIGWGKCECKGIFEQFSQLIFQSLLINI